VQIERTKRHVLVNEFKLDTNSFDNVCDEEVDSIISIEENNEEVVILEEEEFV